MSLSICGPLLGLLQLLGNYPTLSLSMGATAPYKMKKEGYLLLFFFFFFDFLPYLGLLQLDSQARSPIGAIAAGLHHSHSNAESQLHL